MRPGIALRPDYDAAQLWALEPVREPIEWDQAFVMQG
jgi:hypothetical protein